LVTDLSKQRIGRIFKG